MDRRLRPEDTFISTRPPVGGKKVRRKKGVAPRKKKSAFKKRPARAGKIVFDTARARRSRLQALSTAQLLQGAENIAANEIGRQDGGFFAGRQQAPIQVNLGAAQQVDDRVAEAQRRMAVANLVNPAQPIPQDFREAIREALRENQGDLNRAEEVVDAAAGVGEIPPPRDPPIFRPPPQLEPDFGEVDEFSARLGEDIGVEPLEAAEQRGQAEPEVAFEGTAGEAADIIAQATTPLPSSEEEASSAFNFPIGTDAGLFRAPPSSEEGGLSREGFDPTFDDRSDSLRSEIQLRTPTPSETSELPPIIPTANPAFEEESGRIQRGRLQPIRQFISRSGSRAAQLFSRSRGEEEPEREGALFFETPFDESSIVGGNNPAAGRLTINPFEATGDVIGSRAVANPAGSLYESDLESIGFEVAAD